MVDQMVTRSRERCQGPQCGIRRIEVRGRAGEGAVRLSPNEWMKAEQLGETFWLYIVVNCASQPHLWVMNDPASKLEPEGEIKLTSYRVDQWDWRTVAERKDVEYQVERKPNE